MSAKPTWSRGLAAIIAWGGVTTVAAAGSWLGMSTVLTDQPIRAAAATVVTPSQSAGPSESAGGRSRTQPSGSEEATPIRKEWNGWTAVGSGAYERSFYTDGGSAVVRLRPGEAVFVSASPAEGYTAQRQWPQSDRLVISFHAAESLVKIDSMWRDGEPYALVSET